MTSLQADPGALQEQNGAEPAERTRMRQGLTYLRANGATLVAEVAANFVFPYVIYDQAKPALGEVGALIASSAPPILWSLFEFARRRRVDALSLLVLAGIVLSGLAYFGGGSAHLLQLREKLVTALIGLVFLVSAALRRPLAYQLARAGILRRSPSDLADFEGLRDNAFFKRSMTLITVVWGVGLLCEAAVSGVLVYSVSVREYLIIGPVIGNAAMATLGLWTFWYSRRQKRLGQARRAAAASLAASAPPSAG